MHNERASTTWEHYFVTYWWAFAALATIGIISTGILYFEHVAGRHIVDWCGAMCTMFGGLIGALLIVLTHNQLGKAKRRRPNCAAPQASRGAFADPRASGRG